MKLHETLPTLDPIYNRDKGVPSMVPIRNRPVLIVEDDDFIWAKHKRELEKACFTDVTFITNISNHTPFPNPCRFDIILLDSSADEKPDKSLIFLDKIRAQGCECITAIVSRQPSVELYYRAAILGANDFLVRGRYFDIADEITRLLQSSKTVETDFDDTKPITHTGFFRTLGLSQSEIEVLSEYARGFPRYETLAQRTGRSQTRLRKTFSRVFGKLEQTLSVDNIAKLAHILTICSLYGTPRFRMGTV